METIWLRNLAIAAVAMTLPLGAAAQQDDFFGLEGVEEEEEEEVVHAPDTVEVGLHWLGDDAFRFGKYTGLTSERLALALDLNLDRRDDASYWRLETHRLGLPSWRLLFEAGERGAHGVRLGYRQTPNRTLGGGQTPFVRTGAGSLGLPAGWQATAASTAGMTTLAQDLRPVDIGHTRKRFDLGYRRALYAGWAMQFDYRRESKEGTRAIGAAFGSTGGNPRSAILPAPVDTVTDLFDLSFSVGGDRFHAGFAWHGSMFDNHAPSLTWANPFGQLAAWAPGTGFPDGSGRMGFEPANAYHQLRAFGTYQVSATTRANAEVAIGRMRQDAAFLPYTVHPGLTIDEPLPRDSLNGRIDTTMVNLRVNSRPLARLNLIAGYRLDDRDNRTPQEAWRYIAGDSQHQRAEDAARINLPYSYQEQRLDLNAAYRVGRRMRVTAGWQYRDIERDFSEVAGSIERVWRAGLRGEPVEALAISLERRWSDRDAGAYDDRRPFVETHMPGSFGPDDFANHPLLRRYYLADRTRDQTTFRADWARWERFSLGVSGSASRDRYESGFFGLNQGRARSWAVDLGYHPDQRFSASAWATRERLDRGQSGRSFTGVPATVDDPDRDWFVDSADRIDTTGLSFRHAAGGPLELGLDAVLSRSRTRIGVTAGPVLNVAPLPDLHARLRGFNLYARYRLDAVSSVRLGFEHERFRSEDFALDGVFPDTMANVLSLGEPSPRYRVRWVSLSYRRVL